MNKHNCLVTIVMAPGPLLDDSSCACCWSLVCLFVSKYLIGGETIMILQSASHRDAFKTSPLVDRGSLFPLATNHCIGHSLELHKHLFKIPKHPLLPGFISLDGSSPHLPASHFLVGVAQMLLKQPAHLWLCFSLHEAKEAFGLLLPDTNSLD